VGRRKQVQQSRAEPDLERCQLEQGLCSGPELWCPACWAGPPRRGEAALSEGRFVVT